MTHSIAEMESNIDGSVTFRIVGRPDLLKISGVVCGNLGAPDVELICTKTFVKKYIFFPHQYADAVSTVLRGPGTVVIGMTGYSEIGVEKCTQWGITQRDYDLACQNLFGRVVLAVQEAYPSVSVRIADGASNLGIDGSAIAVARELGLMHLGFSCPPYMFYVEDDEAPVYVALNRSLYSDAFVANLDILISVGGRAQALEHDIATATRLGKTLLVANIIPTISKNGGQISRLPDGSVEDATAALIDSVHIIGQKPSTPVDFKDLVDQTCATAVRESRQHLLPEIAFGGWLRK